MPQYDSVMVSHKGDPRKKKKKRKKENIFVSLVRGLIPWKGDSAGEIVRKIVFLISLAALIGALVIIAKTYIFDPVNVENDIKSQILEITNREPTKEEIDTLPEKTINTEYAPFYSINQDFVGWLAIMGTNINYPVVQGEDNEKYLYEDFYGNYSKNGTIFADANNRFGADENMSGNTILYGHNLRSNNFFTEVTDYRRLDLDYSLQFLREHPVIEFNTLYEKAKYKIFSVMLLNTREEYGEVYPYHTIHEFKSKTEFDNFAAECLDRSEFFTGVDIQYGDEFLTLSTCEFEIGLYDMRIVVTARKVRDGENADFTEEELAAFTKNPDPKHCDTVRYIYGLDEWSGRYWDPAWIKGFEKDDSFVEAAE